MLPSPSFTNARSFAINEFNTLRSRAVRNSWLAKILKRKNGPKSFVGSTSTGLQGKRLAGIHSVCIDKIVGTIQRTDDFDKDFRPLKKHLCERWVNALLRLDTNGWQPIVVHKVGDHYFVKDGHHRVSVAKSVGMMFIDAEVWDHSPCRTPRDTCTSQERQPIKRREQVYSPNS